MHYRKPDEDIFRIALDIAQVRPEQVVYVDDRAMFVEVARGLGINGIIHTTCAATRAALEGYGLTRPSKAYGRVIGSFPPTPRPPPSRAGSFVIFVVLGPTMCGQNHLKGFRPALRAGEKEF